MENRLAKPISNPGLVGFYDISIIEGYLILNSILYIWTVLFQTIQLSIYIYIYIYIYILFTHSLNVRNSSISNNSVLH